MNLFNKKPIPGKSSKRIETLYDETGKKGLVLGLQWRSIVTAGGRDAAVKTARAAAATHYVFRGQQLGHGAIPAKTILPDAQLFSAAAVAARLSLGDCIFVLGLGETAPDLYWVAITRNSLPTARDEIIVAPDISTIVSEVEKILAAGEDGAKPVIFTNLPVFTDSLEFNHSLLLLENPDAVREISFQEIISSASSAEDYVTSLPKQSSTIPVPVLIAAGVVVTGLILQSGYTQWSAARRAKELAMTQVTEEDPATAWGRTIEAWQATVAAPDPSPGSLTSVRASLAKLPVTWNGWILSTASCKAGGITESGRQWACSATFARQPGGALTREINEKILPDSGWAVQYTPLNQMIISWTASQKGNPIDIKKLPPALHHKIETVSRLQKLELAFSQAVNFSFAPVEIPPPKKTDGSAYPEDPAIKGLVQAALTVQAPLRSFDAMINSGLDVTWNQLTMTYVGKTAQSSINSSYFSMEAQGVLYAKN